MTQRPTIGFPHMNKESGEKRAFLPDFIQYLSSFADVFLAEGYGSRIGFSFDDYCQGNPNVVEVERKEAFSKDYIIILRSPAEAEFDFIPKGACLISMLHFPTRPNRVQMLNRRSIHAISLDSIIDDYNLRLVENMRAVAWNGIEAAFDILERRWQGLPRTPTDPIRVLILGTGMVGKHAIEAATKFGNVERNTRYIEQNGPGSVAVSVGRNMTEDPVKMEALFRQADILVDATQRRDSGKPVVPNAWIAWLPEHAVVVDLAVDPYLLDADPPTVRGIEGIPQGNLDKYIFEPQDPEWEQTVPSSVPSSHRRTSVTCYSWPGIYPEACMAHYARQMHPLMEVLLAKGYSGISFEGGYFERALCRAKLPSN
ncbi:MAG: alanine dehydrogenase [Anaerolineae bacterium]|nr:alanine dehydrogenase [Anaerolineae bacterium]